MILSCNVIKYNASNTESLECEFISRLSTKLDLKIKKTHIVFFFKSNWYLLILTIVDNGPVISIFIIANG